MNEWDKVKSQLSKLTKDLPAKQRSEINDLIYKEAKSVMETKSLSLIYDQFGNQIYEKTPNVIQYISCKKTGFDLSISTDDSKLLETKHMDDEHNTDFLVYGNLNNIEAENVKHNMQTGFEPVNSYLYKKSLQEEIKKKVFNEGVLELKTWINTKGISNFNKKHTEKINGVVV